MRRLPTHVVDAKRKRRRVVDRQGVGGGVAGSGDSGTWFTGAVFVAVLVEAGDLT
jgi:hypothetical protein